jgi:hypothetical protein
MTFRNLIESSSLVKEFNKRIKEAKKGDCSKIMKEIEACFQDKKLSANEFDEVSASCGRKMDSLNEDHFKIGDKVVCKSSGSTGKIVKIDEPEEGKYYYVEKEDGEVKKYAPDELEKEELSESTTKENWTNLKAFMKKQRGFQAWEFEGDYDTLIVTYKTTKEAGKAFEKSQASANEISAYGDDFMVKGNKIIIEISDEAKKALNEGLEDVVCETKHEGNTIRVHFHDRKYVLKVNQKEV